MRHFLEVIAFYILIHTGHVNALEIYLANEDVDAISESLTLNGGINVETAALGKYKLSVVATGLGGTQTNPMPGNGTGIGDLSNGQFILEKQSGPLQLYAVVGSYSMPELGVPYNQASKNVKNTWGYLPSGWIKIPANQFLSFSVGKLSAIGGLESTFTYQNINIQRGLLWHQTSSITRGMQVDYEDDCLSVSLAWTDGAYSNTYNWFGAQIGYRLDYKNDVTASWNGSLSANSMQNDATSLLGNNSQISTLIYSYKGDHFTVSPYLQYTFVPIRPSIGILGSSNTKGAAVLATYRLYASDENGKLSRNNLSFPLRLEYITSGGNSYISSNNLLYGPNSSAVSATFTPTYQMGMYFARAEASYVKAINSSAGTTFGQNGMANAQFRFLLEGGFLY